MILDSSTGVFGLSKNTSYTSFFFTSIHSHRLEDQRQPQGKLLTGGWSSLHGTFISKWLWITPGTAFYGNGRQGICHVALLDDLKTF